MPRQSELNNRVAWKYPLPKIKLTVKYSLALVLLIGLASVGAWSQNIEEDAAELDSLLVEQSGNMEENGASGLVFDNTRTKQGRDFYDFFYQQWSQAQQDSTMFGAGSLLSSNEDFTILIEETPSNGSNTIVSVTVNDQLLWQQFMQPRLDAVLYLVENAVETIKQYVTNYKEIQSQLGTADQVGTGVY